MEPALGWHRDPYATHELRYFSNGQPTSWVCSDGKIALETVAPVRELVSAAVHRSESRPAASAVGARPPTGDRADGWRRDPWGSHEFRYYEAGEPTSWVATGGTVGEELVVTLDQLLQLAAPEPSFAPRDQSHPGGIDPIEVFLRSVDLAASNAPAARLPETGRAWSIDAGDPWAFTAAEPGTTAHRESAPASATRYRPHAERRRPPRRARLATVTVCAAVAVALITSLAAFAVTSGPDQSNQSSGSHPSAAPHSGPSTARASAPASLPPTGNPTAAWWVATGQPDANRLQADLETMTGQTGDAGALAASCQTFSGDASTATSAPPAPTPSIEREWGQTLATVNRIASACSTGNYSRLAEDLQPATLTIHDLTAQVASYLR